MELDFYTVEEIAKQLKVKEFTVRDWIKKGDLPAYRIGGREYRIKKEDYEEWLKKRRTTDNK